MYATWLRVMAENVSCDNTDTGVPCTDTQCMIDCLSKKLKYGADYTCPSPTNYAFENSILSTDSTDPPTGHNVYLALFSNENKGVCMMRNGIQHCFEMNNYAAESNNLRDVFSGSEHTCEQFECYDYDFDCITGNDGAVGCYEYASNEYCTVSEKN